MFRWSSQRPSRRRRVGRRVSRRVRLGDDVDDRKTMIDVDVGDAISRWVTHSVENSQFCRTLRPDCVTLPGRLGQSHAGRITSLIGPHSPPHSAHLSAVSCNMHDLRRVTMSTAFRKCDKVSVGVSGTCSRAGAEPRHMELVGPARVATIRRYSAELSHRNRGSQSPEHPIPRLTVLEHDHLHVCHHPTSR